MDYSHFTDISKLAQLNYNSVKFCFDSRKFDGVIDFSAMHVVKRRLTLLSILSTLVIDDHPHKAIYFSWKRSELFIQLLGPSEFN